MQPAAFEPAVPLSRRPPRRTIAAAVAFGGVVGSAARVGIGEVFSGGGWPAGTLVSNVIGCLVLGVLWGRATTQPVAPTGFGATWRAGAMTGFCGGLTTFSSFVVEALLWPNGPQGALLWIVGSVVSGIAVFVAGRSMAQRFSGSSPR